MDNPFKDKFLICIDSDGCAIDSMTVKHEKAFGPAFVEIWEVPEDKKATLLKEWNEINLYRFTRGINRFQGLFTILKNHPEICDYRELERIAAWIEKTNILSPQSLLDEYKKEKSSAIGKALQWSDLVNQLIEELPISIPFDGVTKAISKIKNNADIAVVSSANHDAIKEEWEISGLYDFVDYFYSQEDGTKSECIKRLIKQGYTKDKIIMIGDALGDYKAALANQVMFYPILASNETESWQAFEEEYIELFLHQQYGKEVQDKLLADMKYNLS